MPNCFDSGQVLVESAFLPMAGRDPEGRNSELAQRLRGLREKLGYETKRAFATKLGITENRWDNVENGHPLSRQLADIVLSKIKGLTRSYLFDGDPAGLSIDMARRLGELPGSDAPHRQRPRGRERRA